MWLALYGIGDDEAVMRGWNLGCPEVRRIFFPCKGDGCDRPVTFFPGRASGTCSKSQNFLEVM